MTNSIQQAMPISIVGLDIFLTTIRYAKVLFSELFVATFAYLCSIYGIPEIFDSI